MRFSCSLKMVRLRTTSIPVRNKHYISIRRLVESEPIETRKAERILLLLLLWLFAIDHLFTGLYVGCYIIEALLQSDLRCFYDQECVSLLMNAIDYPFNVTPLNVSSPTQYQSTSTINALIDNLFVEEWNPATSYESYYTACQPQSCTYSHLSHTTVIYVISTTIGLIGGLTKIYRVLVPLAMRLIRPVILPFLHRTLVRRNVVAALWAALEFSSLFPLLYNQSCFNTLAFIP